MSQMTGDVRWEIAGKLPAIAGDHRPRVSENEAQMAEELMESTGVVLFRNFDISPDDFRELTRRLGNSFSVEKWTPNAVTRGGPYIGLHTEQAFQPAVPTAIWFYSVKPAERGGATIVCDGAAVWSDLSASAHQFLEETDILYWRRISGTPPPPSPYRRVVEDPPYLGRNYREHELIQHDDHHEWTASCRPLIYSRFGHRPVFGNHILNTIQHQGQDTPPEIDGFHQARLPTREQIPRDLIEELRSVTSQISLRFTLGEKDMVWIDNTRFMHGRQAFEGTRQIIALTAFHADQWMEGCNPIYYKSRTVGSPSATR